MNIGQLDGQPLALQIFNGMTAESICVNERWAKDQLFRCVCFAGGQIKSTPSIAWRTLCFNLRPPCGGRLCTGGALYCVGVTFQSTSSVWRTTRCGCTCARPDAFQSTSSVWRTTGGAAGAGRRQTISIHVLRVEDDAPRRWTSLPRPYFNPRPPCGGRPPPGEHTAPGAAFQSTSSVWRTTLLGPAQAGHNAISIHVLRVEDDQAAQPAQLPDADFNPRPPCGGRPYAPPCRAGHG